MQDTASNPFRASFSGPGLSLYEYADILIGNTQGGLSENLRAPLSVSFLSLYPANSSHLDLPGLLDRSPQVRDPVFLALGHGHSLQQQAGLGEVHKAYLICFPSLNDCCSFLSDAHCLKNIVLHIAWFSWVF